ncbi:hypothetical protein Plhal304r1_c009g0034531 [Plasmopara halstedii]
MCITTGNPATWWLFITLLPYHCVIALTMQYTPKYCRTILCDQPFHKSARVTRYIPSHACAD